MNQTSRWRTNLDFKKVISNLATIFLENLFYQNQPMTMSDMLQEENI